MNQHDIGTKPSSTSASSETPIARRREEMSAPPEHSIKISVDRGGTFTDVHASWPKQGGKQGEEEEMVFKLLSSDPSHYPDAPREGVRRVLSHLLPGKPLSRDAPLPTEHLHSLRLSTTIATNALLERQGAPHVLLVTEGFRDLLHIGNQSRPKIFDLAIKRPESLYQFVVEVRERVTLVGYTSDPNKADRAVVFDDHGKVVRGYDGAQEREGDGEVVQGISGEAVRIIKPLDKVHLEGELRRLYSEGVRGLAVVLMHSFTYPQHEQQIATLAQEIGFTQISLSSSLSSMIRIVPRGLSTTADAYLTPVLRGYLDSFFSGFQDDLAETTSVEFMRSDGGLTDVNGFNGLKSILSGPAGGVVGYALTSWEGKGGRAVIGLDMGGTSTDVSRFDGDYETVFETTTAGISIQSPQLNIETVAAGGGSRLFWRNGLFVTGPESAGSDPGPSCYRKSGPPAITDANLVLGRLLPGHFPQIFGESEKEPLDTQASTDALEKLRAEIEKDTGKKMGLDEVAWGFVKVANETMCRPIRSLTEARGYDTSKHILSCFGGAGGQHACAIAGTLGIGTILIHRYSSVLSAYGMALAERVVERQEPCAETWGSEGTSSRLDKRLEELSEQVRTELTKQGFKEDRIEVRPFLNMRYNGTDSALMVRKPEEGEDFAKAFAKAYKSEFGFSMNVDVIIDDVRVRGIGKSFDSLGKTVFEEVKELDFKSTKGEPEEGGKCCEKASVFYEEGGRQEVPVFLLERLEAGDLVEGPAIIIDGTQTIVVDPNASAKITSKHCMIELGEKK